MTSAKRRFNKVAVHLFLIVLAIVTITPFFYVVMISFGKNVIDTSTFVIDEFTFDNYLRLFSETRFFSWIRNSLILAFVTMLLAVVIVSVSVYVFSRLRFRGKTGLFNFILLVQIFPLTLSMVSIFKIFVTLGLLNRLQGLILADSAFASAGLILLAKGYFDTIPYSLDEAAMIDGANRFKILTRITLPLAKPMIAIIAIQSFVIAYNEYAIASTVMTQRLDSMPLAVGLQSMIVGQFGINWSLYCAGAVLGSIPIVVLFYSLQKYFIGGLTEGSVKS